MATIRVPPNVSSITFTVSGVKVPTAGLVTGLTADEATQATSPYNFGPGSYSVVQTAANGDTDLFIPPGISSITIGGQVKAVAAGKITALGAAIASAYLLGMSQREPGYELVQG